tara:strand:- start:8 stop:403 length:396 start_codon:yes stop_codon:yes gene_type:complete
MALIGNCTYYKTVDTGTTEEVNITLPDGTEEIITVPKYEEVATEFNNVYLAVLKIDTYHTYDLTDEGVVKQIIVFADYAAYESKEKRDEDLNNHLFFTQTPVEDYDYDNNIYVQAYGSIKNVKGLENLTDI